MGDDGRMYVSHDVVPIYRDILLPLATIITPNWYETQLLTGIEIRDLASIQAAFKVLHTTYGIPHVVISSLPIGTALQAELQQAQPFRSMNWNAQPCGEIAHADERLLCVASSVASSDAVSEVAAAIIPRIKGYFAGVGDLFSALVLAHFKPDQGPSVSLDNVRSRKPTGGSRPEAAHTAEALHTALEAALSTTQAILISTHEHCASLPVDDCPPTDDEEDAADPERRVRRMRARELRIVHGLDVILAPPDGLVNVVPWDDFWVAHP